VVVTGSRGTVWGQMDSGRLVVTDPLPSDGTIFVNGAENIAPGRTDAVTIYTGRDLHFRVTGGKYKLSFKGSGIDLTAVGIGTAQLSGDVFADETGKFAVDSGKWSPIPPLVSRSVRFGVPPIAPPTTP
jgi:hypothetical protein